MEEEYEADDLLTELAVGRLNKEANGMKKRSNGTAKRAGSKPSVAKKSSKPEGRQTGSKDKRRKASV